MKKNKNIEKNIKTCQKSKNKKRRDYQKQYIENMNKNKK